MRRFDQKLIGMLVLAAGLPFMAACSFDSFSNIKLIPKGNDVLRPDWLSYTGSKEEFTLRPVGTEDLVGPDGQCAAAGSAPAGPATDESGAGTSAQNQGGIALQMTECEVVRRAGPPERVELGANERGERSVVLTYVGARSAIYRFASGRLSVIERGPEPPAPARPQKGATAKKRG
jgi:hypothetical protein